MAAITVRAARDDEAGVWYVEHSSLPGLHLEAVTPIELYDKLRGPSRTCSKGAVSGK
jgi:hypothetical protein